MPEVKIHPPDRTILRDGAPNALPQLLQTPSGLAILEIQGTIHAPPAKTSDEMNDDSQFDEAVSIGRLDFPLHSVDNPPADTEWMKRVHLYIGKHQRLTGEVKKLPKALAILRRMPSEQENSQEELEIVEIVKYKLVFSQRPEPVGEV